MAPHPVREVDAPTAKDLIDEGAFLLDVREHDEWEAGRAPLATHIPLGQLAARQDELPRDTTVVAVCRVGGRSAQAAGAMARAGYDVVNLDGGMQAWADAGLPVVRDDDEPGAVI
jgi:rhodanese-related sulfurtransferase